MDNELIENLKEYFDNYEESVKMFDSGNRLKSKYPCYKAFYAIKDVIKKLSENNELYLDMKHSNTEFTTNYSKKFEPTMAIYYNDNSKKCRKGDGVYVYIMYPNKELKEINISIELGYIERFKKMDDTYIQCINNIKKLIPKEYIEKFDSNNDRNIISKNINIKMIDNFENIILEIFKIYKIIIKRINDIDGKDYEERYNKFIELISREKSYVIDIHKKDIEYNTIYYGIPGSGKSYYIKNKLLKDLQIKEYERVTFYPEYTYNDFIGTYKITSDKENSIKPCPGPFTRILFKALEDENNDYALVIEELNRGNAEAIFGDIFQLLDRENGESEYHINNDFIEECIGIKEIKIPKNLFLIATINTSDQNVFSLDTAFGRRWEYIRIDDNFSIKQDENNYYSTNFIKGFKNVKWNDFRIAINKEILNPENNIWNREDKQLGLFYISKNQLNTKETEQEIEEDKKKFVYKVIRYLWFDVFKNEEKKLVRVLNNSKLVERELKESNSFDELANQIIY